MKKAIISLSLALIALLSACGSVEPLRNMESSMKIRVECQNNPGVRNMVMGLLKQAKARDITENPQPSCLEIQASYYMEDKSVNQLAGIFGILESSAGVYLVELLDNHNVIKQGR
jgi:hypothetical protein